MALGSAILAFSSYKQTELKVSLTNSSIGQMQQVGGWVGPL